MAFLDFPDTLKVKTFDDDEEVAAGAFTFPDHMEIAHARLVVYKHGSHAGTERLRVNIYSDSAYSNLMHQSDWSEIADIDGIDAIDYWIGWLRFDFDREHVNLNYTYYIAVEIDGYTRDSDAYYIAGVLDWPLEHMTHVADQGLALVFYGYRQ